MELKLNEAAGAQNPNCREFAVTVIADLWSKAFINADEAAILLSVPRSTVLNLHRVGDLSGVLVGKHLRWRPDDLKCFAASLGDKRAGPFECAILGKPLAKQKETPAADRGP